jgi:hypothetical protein
MGESCIGSLYAGLELYREIDDGADCIAHENW